MSPEDEEAHMQDSALETLPGLKQKLREVMGERDKWRERCAFISDELAAYGDHAERDPKLLGEWIDKIVATRIRRERAEAWGEGWHQGVKQGLAREYRLGEAISVVNPYQDEDTK